MAKALKSRDIAVATPAGLGAGPQDPNAAFDETDFVQSEEVDENGDLPFDEDEEVFAPPPNIPPPTYDAEAEKARAARVMRQMQPEPVAAGRSASRSPMRAEEIRGEPIRTRKRKGGIHHDKFHIDPAHIPPGWSYEWKRQTVLGQPDASYDIEMAEQGWTPVPTERHPWLMPKDTPNSKAITREGQILMERPMELTREAQAEDRQNAVGQVMHKEAALAGLAAGAFEKAPASINKLSRSYEPYAPEGLDIPG